ncbi:MAG: hypothetical protein C5B50_00265 [Verrucomicrobia bacterium]|nr:MAG: hypothetical protein C5B50_00265 [Verrucomicrobiota bacterium]
MHPRAVKLIALLFLAFATRAFGSLHYVDVNATNSTPPYSDWQSAATNIQDAIDAAASGDVILVSDGLYQDGMDTADGSTMNRVCATNALTLRSVNGPGATIIDGLGTIRCAYLADGCTLDGFRLQNGTVTGNGGGALCASATVVLTNCVFASSRAGTGGGVYGGMAINCLFATNSSSSAGGGAASATLINCALDGNTGGWNGGGAMDCALNQCRLTGNSATTGGGACQSDLRDCLITYNYGDYWAGGADTCTLVNCTLTANYVNFFAGGGGHTCGLTNCIVFYNNSHGGTDNYSSDCTLAFCCATPLPPGPGNFSDSPLFADQNASDFHLQTNSPCVNAGNNAYVTSSLDLDGNPRIVDGLVDPGPYEMQVNVAFAAIVQVQATGVVTGFPLALTGSTVGGRPTDSAWDFGDGTGTNGGFAVSHAWSAPGDYPVVFTAFNPSSPAGVSASVTIHVVTQAIHYVALDSANPAAPFMSWDMAATNIQDAVDAAFIGGTVLVSNGVYQTGGHVVHGFALTNRLVVDKPVTVQSVNGPSVTVIQGAQLPFDATNFDGNVRCVYLTNSTALIGFTISNGGTLGSGDWIAEGSGGGIWCESLQAMIGNCVLAGNAAYGEAGGCYQGTLTNCILAGNSAGSFGGSGYSQAGGAQSAVLNNCILTNNIGGAYSGGADSSTFNDCILAGNSCWYDGGGAWGSTMNNCVLSNNSSVYGFGGGAGDDSVLNNCLLFGNSAAYGGSGAEGSMLTNCTLAANSIIYQAEGAAGGDWCTLVNCAIVGNLGDGASSSTLNNCTLDGNSGTGLSWCTANNCLAYFNATANYYNSSLNYCCTTPLPSTGPSNITADPQLSDSAHLGAGSPCRGAGNAAYTSSVDIDGEVWADPPSIGCDEYYAGPAGGSLNVAIGAIYTNVASGLTVSFTAQILGRATASYWNFGDGTLLTNATFNPTAAHSWTAAGIYSVSLTAYNDSNPNGVSAATTIFVLQNPIHYVDANGTNPVAPYLSWSSAATNIQDAVDAAYVTATVLVNDGSYRAGGTNGNRVSASKPVAIQSVNGPALTIIDGADLVRCVSLPDGCSLSGFTLTHGSVPFGTGGGLQCGYQAAISNCWILGNWAYGAGGGANGGTLDRCVIGNNSCTYDWSEGGGALGSTLNNCLITNNYALNTGGGVSRCALANCTVVGNGSASYSVGGAAISTLNNCIVWNNGNNYAYCTLNYCCTDPLPGSGINNISADPLFVDAAGADLHLQTNSPCVNAGNNGYAPDVVDLDGNSRIVGSAVDIGAYEVQFGVPFSASVQASTNSGWVGFEFSFTGSTLGGPATTSQWDFGDGATADNQLSVSHIWSAPGDYAVLFTAYNSSYPGGVSASVTVHVGPRPIHYVSLDSANPIAPYLSWDTAATNIQDAVDAALIGGLVLVTNGVYSSRGSVMYGSLTNRVAVTNRISVQSVNGPAVTVIQGNPALGDGAVRCVFLSGNNSLIGFQLASGATRTNGDVTLENSGGGVWCQDATPVVSNCTVVACSAAAGGGGAYGGTFYNCAFLSNSASYGGAACNSLLGQTLISGNTASSVGGGLNSCTASNCALISNVASGGAGWPPSGGGGAQSSTLINCILLSNTASAYHGGGACASTLTNCLLRRNSGVYGGGVSFCTVDNSTVTEGSSSWGGGVFGGTVNNSIVYYNTGANYAGGALATITWNYSCTTPFPGGSGNFKAEPMFVDPLAGNYQLQTRSPCINAGNNSYVTMDADLNGNPRIVDGTVDVGAYEYHRAGPLTPAIQAEYTNVAAGFAVNLVGAVAATEQAVSTAWNFGDGATATNQLRVAHSWSVPGDYVVQFTAYNETFPGGVAATVVVHVIQQPVFYVSASSTNPAPPYLSWQTAARNIQDAIDAASEPGSLVLVTNGIYSSGGKVVYGALTNRAALTKPIVVQSVNGAATTSIQGVPTGGDSAVRCVYLTNHATLEGFTVALGATRTAGDSILEQSGGGIWSEATNAVVSDCVVTGNWANNGGGGAAGGTFVNCTFTNNSTAANGGAVLNADLYGCVLVNNSAPVFGSYGGGAENCTLDHCFFTGNTASIGGGGADNSTVFHSSFGANSAGTVGGALANSSASYSSFTNNSAWAGGAVEESTLTDCLLAGNSAWYGGGGAGYYCTLNNCILRSNTVSGNGGGAGVNCTLNNCLLTGNQADGNGGGVGYWCTLNNCTLAENSAGGTGGGADLSTLYNCIVYFNLASSNLNYSASTFSFCCTTPDPGGAGNITNDPAFLNPGADDFHLQSTSPCINAGDNAYALAATDLDGNPRIRGGTVDIGAYEIQNPTSIISYAWLQHYGLATDGAADFADPDRDGMNNWQEWICGTDPNDASSVLKLLTPSQSGSGVTLTWQSVSGKTYFVQRSTNLLQQPAFISIQTGIPGQPGMSSFTDTSANPQAPCFYRIGIEH